MQCRKCNVELIVGQNWYKSREQKQENICISCHKKDQEARRRSLGMEPRPPNWGNMYGVPCLLPDGSLNPKYDEARRRFYGQKPKYPTQYGVPEDLPDGRNNPEYGRRSHKAKRDKALVYYSGTGLPRCADPYLIHKKEGREFTVAEALHFDHIDDNGAEERAKYGPNVLGRMSKKTGFPDGYQVLCANCNWLKYLDQMVSKRSKVKKDINRRKRRDKIRLVVISHYSNDSLQCADPYHIHETPFADIRCLTLDHIDGAGRKHKLKYGYGDFTMWLYQQFIEYGQWIDGIQVLCWNCQFIKRVRNKELLKRNV